MLWATFRHWFPSGLDRRTRHRRLALISLLALACLHRVWLVFAHGPMASIWSDPGRHWQLGSHPLDTQPFAAIDPVGYHVYLAALAKLTAGSPILVSYWTALLTLSVPWIWYRYFRELVGSRDWALTGALALAALPSWSGIYSYFMQETLMLPLLGAALWATWRCRRKQDVASFVLAAVAWMLAGLTRGICIPLAAAAMLWLWVVQSHKLEKAVLAGLALALVLAPLAGRSWYLARQFSPHGIGTMNSLYARSGAESFSIDFSRQGGTQRWSYEFKSPAMLVRPFEPFSDYQSRRLGHVHYSIDLDAGSRDWVQAKKSLPPWSFSRSLWLTGDNLIGLFFTPSWPDSNRETFDGGANYWSRWIWVPLTVACLWGAWRLRGRQPERMVLLLMLVWFLFQGLLPLAVNEGRYRKPFEGLLIAQCLLLAASVRPTVGTRRSPDGGEHRKVLEASQRVASIA